VAGARLVIGIDASDIILQARVIVEANGLSDRVKLFQCPLEKFELPAPLEKVDVIVSEWMGYFLLYESMLPTVLTARERWLAPGGLMLPSSTTMLVAASCHDRLAFWSDVYGFTMDNLAEISRKEASVEVVPPETLLTEATTFKTLDAGSVQEQDLDFTASFQLVATKDGTVRSLVVHFDTFFDCASQGGGCSSFTTGSLGVPTHWKQTVLYLRAPLAVVEGDRISGMIGGVRAPAYARGYDISATVSLNDGPSCSQVFKMY